jgi:cobalt/nickel transport protein
MKRFVTVVVLVVCLVLFASTVTVAHFGMIIPSDEMVMKAENSDVGLQLMFWHPFEGAAWNSQNRWNSGWW